MALVGLHLDEADVGRHRVQRVHDLAALARGIEPVAGERHHAEARLGALEGIGQHVAVLGRQVEVVDGAGDVEIAVGIEAVDERRALVAQIALDLEVGVERKALGGQILQGAAEFALQRLFRKIGDMRGHARHGQAVARLVAEFQVAPLRPVRVGHDRLPADLVEGDVLRGMPGGGGNRHRGRHPFGMARRPRQHLHAAHGAADDAKQLVDAEMIDQRHLRLHHVADGDDGKIQAPGLAGLGVDAGRSRRAHAAAEHVGADDEEAVGVDGLARTHHRLPPAGLAGDGMRARHVLVAGQGVRDQNGIRLCPIQDAVGLVGDAVGGELPLGIEAQGLEGGNVEIVAAGRGCFQHAGVHGRREVEGIGRIHKCRLARPWRLNVNPFVDARSGIGLARQPVMVSGPAMGPAGPPCSPSGKFAVAPGLIWLSFSPIYREEDRSSCSTRPRPRAASCLPRWSARPSKSWGDVTLLDIAEAANCRSAT